MHLDNENTSKDTLGDRMKRYEEDALRMNGALLPVVIRLDGNHFHTWVKYAKLQKPFDDRMISAMQEATFKLCENIPSCIMGYCQSDEISLVLRPGESENWEPWFQNRVQKLCSVSASICSVAFNDAARRLLGSDTMPAFFDARVMFMPDLDEIVNCLIWRQNDCVKNSISALSQSLFSPKMLLNKNSNEQLQMQLEKGVDWNALPTVKRFGTLVHKKAEEGSYRGVNFTRGRWFIDTEIPRFSTNKEFLKNAYSFKVK